MKIHKRTRPTSYGMSMFLSTLVLVFLTAPTFFALADGPFIAPLAVPIKILIVPGHDNEVWGAEYNGMKEADMTLALGDDILNNLKNNPRFKIYITRDAIGYTKDFASYFASGMEAITTFKNEAQKLMQKKIKIGTFKRKSNGISHSSVKTPVALRLYGINKWADENKIDAIIHIHFNDDGRRNKSKPGPYKGFSVYMPDSQLPNSKTTRPLAIDIFNGLEKKYTDSTYLKSNGGVVTDQKLIAMGANATLLPSVRSVLVEYGFIYEDKFSTIPKRDSTFATMAEVTTNAIIDYFYPKTY